MFTAEAPGDIYQLEHWGCYFTRNEDGKLAQRPFGAAGSPRTVFAADITGHVLIQVLYEQVMKREIPVYEEFFAWRLVEDDGECVGVVCWDLLGGGLKLLSGKSIVLATGGAGRIFRVTTNAYACTGDGMAMALRVGLPLKDMEFMQFHPTTLYPTRDPPHGRLPRRGRLPHQLRGRPLHGHVRAERDGARVARRRLALRADGDRPGPRRQRLRPARHAPPRRGEDPDAAARLARAVDDVRRRRSDLRARAGAAGCSLPHGWRRDGQRSVPRSSRASTRPASARASRCTARTASGATRSWRRSRSGAGRGRAAAEHALAHNPAVVTAPRSALTDAEDDLKTPARPRGGRAAVEDPRRPRLVDARELRRLPSRGADDRRGRRHRGASRALRARRRRGQGRRLQQRPDAGARARLRPRPRVGDDQRGHRAQGEPRRARTSVRLSRARRRELPQALDHALARRSARSCPGRMCG